MTAPYQHLAWLTDGSERAAAAQPWVTRLAGFGAATVQVVMATGAARSEALREDARARVEQALDSLRLTAGSGTAQVLPGQPAAVAEALVGSDGVDLVVCGRTGATGLDRLLLGSTAQRLVRRLPCDVLVAERPEGTRLKTVLVPLDPRHADQPALTRALALARATKAELHLLTITDDPDPAALAAARQRLDALAAAAVRREGRAPVRAVAVHADRAAAGILQLAAGHDLVVMGASGRRGLERLLLGSVTEAVVARCPAPVLVARPRS